MTESAARTWLSSHHDIIPALEVFHAQALEILEDNTKTLRDLADVIVLDPGMSVSLYHEVNNKLVEGKKQSVDSVHAALSLLGDGKIADLVILSANPLTIDPLQLGTIKVLETIKEGRTVYRAD